MKVSKKTPSTLILFSGIFLLAFSFSDSQLIPVDAQEFRQAPDYNAVALDGTGKERRALLTKDLIIMKSGRKLKRG